MLARIQTLAACLGLGQGPLLKLARDIAEDGALISLAHMRGKHQERLLTFLERAYEYEQRGRQSLVA